jgi:hypothetical protein
MLSVEGFSCTNTSITSASVFPLLTHYQSATSEPKGPVYLWARREVMEQEVDDATFEKINTNITKAPSIEGGALSPNGEHYINSLTADRPPPDIPSQFYQPHAGSRPHFSLPSNP